MKIMLVQRAGGAITIAIPLKIARNLGIKKGDSLEVKQVGEKIEIRKVKDCDE